jgi:hypothetical protein
MKDAACTAPEADRKDSNPAINTKHFLNFFALNFPPLFPIILI